MQRGPMGVVRASPRRHDFGIQTLGAWPLLYKTAVALCLPEGPLPALYLLSAYLSPRTFVPRFSYSSFSDLYLDTIP